MNAGKIMMLHTFITCVHTKINITKTSPPINNVDEYASFSHIKICTQLMIKLLSNEIKISYILTT